MMSSEIAVGDQNPYLSRDLKVGIACTYVLGEGVAKSLAPVIKIGATRMQRDIDFKRMRGTRFINQRRRRLLAK